MLSYTSTASHITYSNKSEVFLHWPPVCTAATATSHISYPGIPTRSTHRVTILSDLFADIMLEYEASPTCKNYKVMREDVVELV